MSREEFLKLENQIGVSPFWEALRKETGKRKSMNFSLRAFTLGPKELKSVLEQGQYEFIANPRTKLVKISSMDDYYQEIYQLFDFQDKLTIVVGHLDAGWKSLAVSRFDGAQQLQQPLHVISKDGTNTFSFFTVQYEFEVGGFMTTCFGARDKLKGVKQELEIRMVHNCGLRMSKDSRN